MILGRHSFQILSSDFVPQDQCYKKSAEWWIQRRGQAIVQLAVPLTWSTELEAKTLQLQYFTVIPAGFVVEAKPHKCKLGITRYSNTSRDPEPELNSIRNAGSMRMLVSFVSDLLLFNTSVLPAYFLRGCSPAWPAVGGFNKRARQQWHTQEIGFEVSGIARVWGFSPSLHPNTSYESSLSVGLLDILTPQTQISRIFLDT